MSKKKVSKEKSIRHTKTLTELVVCVVIIAVGGYAVKIGVDNVNLIQQSQYVNVSDSIDIQLPNDTEEEIDPDKIIFTYASVNTKDKFSGDLILVNNYHEYFSTGEENLISIGERNYEEGNYFFSVVDTSYLIMDVVYEPMVRMIKDFYDIYENDTLIIYGSYRTNEFQQQLYESRIDDEESEFPSVAKPGCSEHETGYAFDFSEIIEYDYQGTGDFAWINENCYKYGFIVRYPEEKESITEYRYEPWHFRYVGVPHATYMMKNNICMEEYIDLLRYNYAYDMEHLEVIDDDGAEYEIFFFESDDSSEVTSVPVPTGYKYDISGNNVDGFIVTVYKGEVDTGEEIIDTNKNSEETTDEAEDEQY